MDNNWTHVINVRKAELQKRGHRDFNDWDGNPFHLYIGRNMSYYVPGTHKSKWANPFSVKKYGLEESLNLYEKYVRESDLYDQLEELLEYKELGCWCIPDPCHGDILLRLLREKLNKNK